MQGIRRIIQMSGLGESLLKPSVGTDLKINGYNKLLIKGITFKEKTGSKIFVLCFDVLFITFKCDQRNHHHSKYESYTHVSVNIDDFRFHYQLH